jgi:hypothetical protein
MDVEIKRTGRGDDQALNPRFLVRFALRYRKNIFLTVAMASELQPTIELSMMMQ